jgi:hypothetical protein
MRKIMSFIIAMLFFVMPVYSEESETIPVTPEMFVGYWEALGLLTESEIVPAESFTTFTVKSTVNYIDDEYCATFDCKIDGESIIMNPWWKEDELEFETGYERYNAEGVFYGVGYVYWSVLEDGNLALAYDGPEGAYTIVFAPAEPPVLEGIVGKWVNTKTYDRGSYFEYPSFGMDFIFNEDGTGTMEYAGSWMGEGVWTQDGDKILFDLDGNIFEFVVNGTTLEMRQAEDFAHVYELN